MNTLTENDDQNTDDELIPVETPPEDDRTGDVDADDEDERLSTSDDDHEEDVTSSGNRERRRKRREIQKRAKEAAQREIEELRRTVAMLSQRVAATENHAVSTNVQTLEQRLAQAQAEVQQAERIIAAATEAGNGNDVVAAMRIRDEAIAQAQHLAGEAQRLITAKQQLEAARNAPPPVDPNVVNYAKQWMEANPWYDPQARDRDSAVTKAIDNELAREGYNPASREYWEELTARVAEALGEDADGAPQAKSQSPRRKAPPTGNTREHAPVNTRKEIYVTPERKQAMIEAGVWDDPVQRQRYLKAYQAYDNGSAR